MPLFTHRSSSSSYLPTSSTSSTSSSPSKTHHFKQPLFKKLNYHFAPLPILLFSFISLFVGLSGTIFAVSAFLRQQQQQPTSVIHRCNPSSSSSSEEEEDTFRSVYNDGGFHHQQRPKLLGFVGILTAFHSTDRRDALRNTWFPSDPDGLFRLEQATGLAFRFVIGRSKDADKMSQLEKEINKFKDFMLVDVEEEYLNLPYKTLAFFKAAFKLFEADYYVKADDDIYMRPDRLATLLAKERSNPQTYIGCMKKGPVITDPKLKWYEKSGHLIGNEYFLHAYGPIYVLSAEVVASLAAARNNSLRMFINEDVTIGSWMLAMNVHHEDNRAICDPHCTPTSIAVWDIPKCSGLCNPADRMKELHKIDMCSKSPTLPSDNR